MLQRQRINKPCLPTVEPPLLVSPKSLFHFSVVKPLYMQLRRRHDKPIMMQPFALLMLAFRLPPKFGIAALLLVKLR